MEALLQIPVDLSSGAGRKPLVQSLEQAAMKPWRFFLLEGAVLGTQSLLVVGVLVGQGCSLVVVMAPVGRSHSSVTLDLGCPFVVSPSVL